MRPDPILDAVYAAKEALSAKYGDDLHALAESFRQSPSWTPRNRPARPIRTAQARLRMLTDPGDEIRELRKVKEQIAAEIDADLHNVGDAMNKYRLEHPLPPTKTRKMA